MSVETPWLKRPCCGPHCSCCVEAETDVVEPFGDQVFIAGVPYIRVVQQQDRGPVNQVALRDESKTLPLQRIGNVLTGNDDAGFRNPEVSGSVCPFRENSRGLVLGLKIKIKHPCQRAAHLFQANLEKGEAPQNVELLVRKRRKFRLLHRPAPSLQSGIPRGLVRMLAGANAICNEKLGLYGQQKRTRVSSCVFFSLVVRRFYHGGNLNRVTLVAFLLERSPGGSFATANFFR